MVGIAVSMSMVLVALPVGALLGVYPADFTGVSGFRQVLQDQTGTAPGSVGVIVAVQLALIPVAAFVGVLPALGEEIGWRGWLLPKLMPLGPVPAILVSGVIRGIWHAPVLLLGYNYPDAPGWLAVASMSVMCVLVGAVLGWLRLRSGSVWPAALGHSAFNATAGSYLMFAQAGATVDTTQATVLGWSGWIVPLGLVIVLVATGQFTLTRTTAERAPRSRVGPPPPAVRPPSSTSSLTDTVTFLSCPSDPARPATHRCSYTCCHTCVSPGSVGARHATRPERVRQEPSDREHRLRHPFQPGRPVLRAGTGRSVPDLRRVARTRSGRPAHAS
ncbi:CPBP family intramembrane glutamic endopeptidase [Pseudonocardia sp. HH130629-09]|uniref:CPBP family intramembrane glutamic endopeptidase n=1 Tax=Pseudonocardia sp. HH130629-09 TaxID=1641402 RepID=UPI001EE75BAB|nr:CPBP family intramembrane glutamic endopeptidase [Pseudonocardia sp. HH130629-09]